MKIIKLLGGTDNFICRPFLYEGMFFGLAGSIVAWLLVDSMMILLRKPMESLVTSYHVSFQVRGLTIQSTLWIILLGIFLGYLGANWTTKRFLKKIDP